MLDVNELSADGILELRMDRAPANALNPELVAVLRSALTDAVEVDARGIILSGRDGMFSGGLDVEELLELDEPAMLAFWQDFIGLLADLAGSPVPIAVALTGHSPAGGAVLAIQCDYRVAVEGRYKIGLNEVRVGLPVPSSILFALERLTGRRRAADLTVHGTLMSPADALAAGIVDELAADPEAAGEAAAAWLSELLQLPPVAMNRTRLLAKEPLLEKLTSSDDARVATDYWFSDETQQAMRALVASLKG